MSVQDSENGEQILPLPQLLKGKAKTGIVLVGPDEAKALLSRNKQNRRIRPHRVEEHAQMMRAGEWMVNNDAICIDTNGELLNGQHRLKAVIEVGIPQSFLFLLDADPESFKTMDTPTIRSHADTLGKDGHQGNLTTLSAALHWLHWDARAWTMSRQKEGTSYRIYHGSRYRVDRCNNIRILELADQFPDIKQHLCASNQLHPRGMVRPGMIAWLSYRTHLIDPERSKNYLTALARGANLDVKDPLLLTRNFLINNLSSHKTYDVEHVGAILIKGWNHQGKKMHRISWSPDREEFPELLGEVRDTRGYPIRQK